MARPNKIWFRKSTGWWMIEIAGKQHKLAKGRGNKPEAERHFHELMASRTEMPESADARVADIVEAFLAWSQLHCAADTYRLHTYYCQLFAEACGSLKATELKPFHVTRWVDCKIEKGDWGETTSYNARRIAFRICSWAAQEKILRVNPLLGLPRPKPAPRERALTLDEYDAIYRAARKPFQRFLLALRNTGARPKEIRDLKWSQVRDDRWVLKEHKTRKKTGKPRIIYLTSAMRLLMTELGIERNGSDFVFLNCEGQPWTMNAVRLQVTRLKVKLNLESDVCAYLLRHMWGTQAILNGVDVATVAECMGHTSLEMVSTVYVHLAEQHQHLQGAMEKAIGNPTPCEAVQRSSA